MTKRDHEPFVLDKCRGLYARRDTTKIPEGYLSKAINLVYDSSHQGSFPASELGSYDRTSIFRMREDMEGIFNPSGIIIDFHVYEKTDGFIIVVMFSINSGADRQFKAWDGTSTSTILTLTGNTADAFHGITINDRFYFAPQKDGLGMDGEFVYVYNPDEGSTARKAAGVVATGTFTVSAGTTSGAVVEPGTHIIAISNVTASGYRTKPALFQTYTAPSTKAKIDLDVIPLGPAGTVSRVISMSKVVKNYDGNPEPIELFFVLEIANNTTTTLADAINLYDSQLVSSMDIYAGNLQEIPAGNWLTNLDGRLVVSGAFDDPHTLRISHQNEPEAIDEVDGLREVMRGDGQSVNTTRPYHGDLFWWKSTKTGIMKVDPTLPPSEWPIELLDGALGAETFAVGEVLNSGAPVHDTFLVGNNDGLHVFSGVYHNILKPISYNIEYLWKSLVSVLTTNKLRIAVDPLRNRVYCIMNNPTIQRGQYWLVGDFSEGLNADSIKWSVWDMGGAAGGVEGCDIVHILFSPNMTNLAGASFLDFGPMLVTTPVVTSDGIILYLPIGKASDGSDNTLGSITAEAEVRFVADEHYDIHIDSVKMQVTRVGSVGVTSEALTVTGDTSSSISDLDLTQNVPKIIDQGFNITGRDIKVNLQVVGGDIQVADIIVHGNIPYMERPDR